MFSHHLLCPMVVYADLCMCKHTCMSLYRSACVNTSLKILKFIYNLKINQFRSSRQKGFTFFYWVAKGEMCHLRDEKESHGKQQNLISINQLKMFPPGSGFQNTPWQSLVQVSCRSSGKCSLGSGMQTL